MIWDVRVFDTLASTQETLKQQPDLAEYMVVQARQQTHGKGRQGKPWIGGQGNLALSFYIRPQIPPENFGQISILTALALAQTAQKFTDKAVTIKWPNDVMLNGKKAAGILLEVFQNGVIVGVGMNSKTAPDEFEKLGDIEVDPVRDAFLQEFLELYKTFQNQGLKAFQEIWNTNIYKKNEAITVQNGANTVQGINKGINENGHLILENPDGTYICKIGDIVE